MKTRRFLSTWQEVKIIFRVRDQISTFKSIFCFIKCKNPTFSIKKFIWQEICWRLSCIFRFLVYFHLIYTLSKHKFTQNILLQQKVKFKNQKDVFDLECPSICLSPNLELPESVRLQIWGYSNWGTWPFCILRIREHTNKGTYKLEKIQD